MKTTPTTLVLFATVLLLGACDKSESGSSDGSKAAQGDRGDDDDGDKGSDQQLDPDDHAESASNQAEQANGEYAGFDERVIQAARVAREIEQDPTGADDVLANNDMDREALDALMFEIARDPDLTGQYRIARGL